VTAVRRPVLVSAHRGGGAHPAQEVTTESLARTAALGVDYVELDVRRTRDGCFVVGHDPDVLLDGEWRRVTDLDRDQVADASPRLLPLDDALEALGGRAGVHLDLKLRSRGASHELAATARSVGVLGPGRLLVTGGGVDAIRAVRDWSLDHGRPLLAGLSIGGTVAGRPLSEQTRLRWAELFPTDRFARSRADVVVANHWLALLTLARFARRAGLPLAVWTTDTEVLLRHWLRPGRAWLVTTNRPERALAIRDRLARRRTRS
jgi:glycerophosphoryl diester phosphodiesterase